MPDTDDEIIEAMARAMCVADGKNPDEDIPVYKPVYVARNPVSGMTVFPDSYEPLWKEYIKFARRQLAAHRAMIKAKKEQGE